MVTTDNWFIGPDGESYKSAWGTCILEKMEDVFGFTPSRPSTNWYLKVGSDEKQIIIAGCQIHYAIRADKRPESCHKGKFYKDHDSGVLWHEDRIYYAED